MLRDAIGKQLDHDPNFRWRGEAVTRIENLSDIAFAVALGMLISGVDAPRNLGDLRAFLGNIAPMAAGFAVLLGLWHAHYTFFRRYGVADKTIITLNAMLIFVILFMAYPLRFAFDSFFSWITTVFTGDYSRSLELGILSFDSAGEIFAYFAGFYAIAFMILALMLGHIVKKRDLLALSAYELSQTRQLAFARWGQCLISAVAGLLSWFTPLNAIMGIAMALFSIPFILAKRRYAYKTEPESDHS